VVVPIKPLAGLHFCITGEFGEKRDSIVRKLISLGATRHPTVSPKVNLLIAGTDPGELKLRRAGAMGISIVGRFWLVNALAFGNYKLGKSAIEVENA
jgi:NAD-dependent DNA ligase